jgi:hypothetical protein
MRLPGRREHSSWRWLTKNILFANDPDQERYRRFFSSACSARSVAARRPGRDQPCSRLFLAPPGRLGAQPEVNGVFWLGMPTGCRVR